MTASRVTLGPWSLARIARITDSMVPLPSRLSRFKAFHSYRELYVGRYMCLRRKHLEVRASPVPRNLEVEWTSLVDANKIFKETGLVVHFTDHPPNPDVVLTQLCPNVGTSWACFPHVPPADS